MADHSLLHEPRLHFENIEPDDDSPLPHAALALYIGDASEGNQVVIECETGAVATFKGLQSGSRLAVRATKVFRTGTTVRGLVAFYAATEPGNGLSRPIRHTGPEAFLDLDFAARVFHMAGARRTFSSLCDYTAGDGNSEDWFPRTMVAPNGTFCFQPHNLINFKNPFGLKPPSVLVIPVRPGHLYTIKWIGQPEIPLGQIFFCGNRDGTGYQNVLTFSAPDYFGSRSIEVTTFQSVRIVPTDHIYLMWMFVSTLPVADALREDTEPVFIEGQGACFKIPPDYLDPGEGRRRFQPRQYYQVHIGRNSETGAMVSEIVHHGGLLIETADSTNQLPNSQVDSTWSGYTFLRYFSRVEREPLLTDPAGQQKAAVLRCQTQRPKGYAVCPYPVSFEKPGPCTISFFVFPLTCSVIQIAVFVPAGGSGDSAMSLLPADNKEKVVAVLDLQSREGHIRRVPAPGREAEVAFDGAELALESYPNGWWRVAVQFTEVPRGEDITFSVRPGLAARAAACARAKPGKPGRVKASERLAGSYFALWGPQVEPAEYPSCYLPTRAGARTMAGGERLALQARDLPLDWQRMALLLDVDVPRHLLVDRTRTRGALARRLVLWLGTAAGESGLVVYFDYGEAAPWPLRLNVGRVDHGAACGIVHPVQAGERTLRLVVSVNNSPRQVVSFLNKRCGRECSQPKEPPPRIDVPVFFGVGSLGTVDEKDPAAQIHYRYSVGLKRLKLFYRPLEHSEMLNLFNREIQYE